MLKHRKRLAQRLLLASIAGLVALLASLPASAASAADMDFWLGSWSLSWTQPDGSTATGRNTVSKILGGKVVREAFDGAAGTPLRGVSHSVYDKQSGLWKQTWVDNSGSYLDFTGGPNADGTFELWRGGKNRAGEPILQRMVFFNIEENSLDWRWEQSNDGGSAWTTLWRIRYTRNRALGDQRGLQDDGRGNRPGEAPDPAGS